jgi:ligand-binding SRPBCC domain-containing protein
MSVVRLTTHISAPVERCFDLSRSIDLHVASTGKSGERAVAGVTSGLLAMGQEVTWSARHFGLRQHLTSRITAFDPPRYFQDTMVRGAFKKLVHDHYFVAKGGETVMTDVFDFEAPLGPLGRLAECVLLARYMTRLLEERNRVVKETAESDRWKEFLKERG